MPITENDKKIDFIGIGSAKSASTWVAECLVQHPQISFSSTKTKKEIRFFNTSGKHVYVKDNDNNYSKGISWYISQFPEYDKNKIRGEFSISYLTDEEAAKNIYNVFPNVKLLVILKNPADMLYSLYWWCMATIEITVPDTFEEYMRTSDVKKRGLYFYHLKRYLDLFPRENIHIIIFDDVVTNPDKVIKSLYEFLGVDTSFSPTIKDTIVNKSINYKNKFIKETSYYIMYIFKKLGFIFVNNFLKHCDPLYAIYYKLNVIKFDYPKMSVEAATYLRGYYKEDIMQLEKLLNRDLSHWYK